MARMRVVLADDNDDFLGAITGLLDPEFEVVSKVSDGQALVEEAERLDPDLILLDISMPVLNGIEAARHLRAAGSQVKIIFLTVHEDADYVRCALRAGAQGYVVKSRLATDLPLALNEVLRGRSFVSHFDSPQPIS